jgi:hypothetical protein
MRLPTLALAESRDLRRLKIRQEPKEEQMERITCPAYGYGCATRMSLRGQTNREGHCRHSFAGK